MTNSPPPEFNSPIANQTGRSPQASSSEDLSSRDLPSVWNYKPWWCQPWSILLAGTSIIGGSWYLFKMWWVTGIIAAPILVWMGFFLLIYPRLMIEYLANPNDHSSSNSSNPR